MLVAPAGILTFVMQLQHRKEYSDIISIHHIVGITVACCPTDRVGAGVAKDEGAARDGVRADICYACRNVNAIYRNILKGFLNIPARNTPRIRKDGNRKSGSWKLSLRSIGNLDSGYLETCLL